MRTFSTKECEPIGSSFDAVSPESSVELVRPFLWRYLLPRSGKSLYAGASARVGAALARHFGSCETISPERHAQRPPELAAPFDVVVYDEGGAIDEPFLNQLISLCAPDATLFIRFMTPGAARRSLSPISAATCLSRVRRLLRRAGFASCDLFWFRDGFLPPRLYAMTRLGARNRPDAERCSPLAWYARPRAVALLARRGRDRTPMEIEFEHGEEVEHGQVLVGSEPQSLEAAWLGSGNVHRLECRDAIVRLPLEPQAVARCRNNFDTLRSLAGSKLQFSIPRALCAFDYDGLPGFIESRAPGRPMDVQLAPRLAGRLAPKAIAALIDLQRKTRCDEIVDEPLFERLVQAPCARLAPSLPADLAEKLRAVQSVARAALSGRQLPLVQLHGDFKGTNLLWTDDERLASVIDWDLASPRELPVIDHAFFAAYEIVAKTRCSFGEALATAGDPGRLGEYDHFAFGELGLTRLDYTICSLMALVRYGNFNAGFHTPSSRSEWCARNLNSGLRQMIATLAAQAEDPRHVA